MRRFSFRTMLLWKEVNASCFTSYHIALGRGKSDITLVWYDWFQFAYLTRFFYQHFSSVVFVKSYLGFHKTKELTCTHLCKFIYKELLFQITKSLSQITKSTQSVQKSKDTGNNHTPHVKCFIDLLIETMLLNLGGNK